MVILINTVEGIMERVISALEASRAFFESLVCQCDDGVGHVCERCCHLREIDQARIVLAHIHREDFKELAVYIYNIISVGASHDVRKRWTMEEGIARASHVIEAYVHGWVGFPKTDCSHPNKLYRLTKPGEENCDTGSCPKCGAVYQKLRHFDYCPVCEKPPVYITSGGTVGV